MERPSVEVKSGTPVGRLAVPSLNRYTLRMRACTHTLCAISDAIFVSFFNRNRLNAVQIRSADIGTSVAYQWPEGIPPSISSADAASDGGVILICTWDSFVDSML
ncbi:hypothetical protein CBL_05355 [Carabus blaptoides fortunei]